GRHATSWPCDDRGEPSRVERGDEFPRERLVLGRGNILCVSGALEGQPDDSDAVVVETREPPVPIGTGGEVEWPADLVVGQVVGGDDSVERDPTDAVVGVGEPEV